MKVIDVSEWQGVINWEAVKPQINGALLRCGYGGNVAQQDDKQWARNVKECIRLGIPFGVYVYGYAKTEAGIRSEAEHVLRLVNPFKQFVKFPIYYDAEERSIASGLAGRMKIFGDIIEGAGYWCGFYSYESYINQYVGTSCDRYTKWVAKYSTVKPNIAGGKYDGWQYSSKARFDGIVGNVDVSEFYKDFPTIIGGSGKTEEAPKIETKLSNEQIADQIIAGEWGIDPERANKLKAAGYDRDTIQSIVNEKMKAKQAVHVAEYYTVHSGDTLSAIANKYGTTVTQLMEWNTFIKNKNVIYSGWRLRVR